MYVFFSCLLGLLVICLGIFGICATFSLLFDSTNLDGAFSAAVIFVFSLLLIGVGIFGIYTTGYRSGNIDGIRGVHKYELRQNEDGTSNWKQIEQLESEKK